MRIKRYFAVLLAALMLFTAASAIAAPKAPSAEEKGTINNTYANINGCLLTYTDTNATYPCTTGSIGSRKYVQITNGGHSNSAAGFTSCEFVMNTNDEIHFEVWYETELGYDWFNFYVTKDGSETRDEHLSGELGEWLTHTYVAPAAGTYSFRWEYAKDSSNDVGSDCVRISGIYLDEHWNYERADAGTAPGTGVFEYDFSGGSYPWKAAYSTSDTNHPSYLRSSNYGVSNSTCQFKVMEHTRECTLKFDYAVDCEEQGSSGTFYDYFEVTVDGTSVLKLAGNYWAHWYSFSYELSQGWHEIVFKYVKDGSTNTSNDCAAVDNIELVYPSPEGMSRWADINVINYNLEKLYFNTGAGSTGWGSKINENGSGFRYYPNNRYLVNSESSFETIVNMAEGETVSFDYVVSSEDGADYLRFYANGDFQFGESGWKDRFWHSYTFTAPYTGAYVLVWEYEKDGSINEGWDYAYIRNIQYHGTYNYDLLDIDEYLLSEYSAPVHFTTEMNYGRGFQVVDIPGGKDGDDFAVISRNRYMEGTTAKLEGDAGHLLAGSTIYFDYMVSSEEDYDDLTLYIKKGSSIVRTVELGSGDMPWRYYETTLTEEGDYTFIWEYAKDNNINENDDYAMIANVSVYAATPSLDDAINSDDTDLRLHFEDNFAYPFVVEALGSSYCAKSTNAGVSSSESLMTASANLHAGDTVSFYFIVSSEQNYDKFTFRVNNVVEVSGSGDPGIQLFTWTAPSNGNYEFRWEYTKDSSVNNGDDCVKVMEVKVDTDGTPGGMLGDVNNDGAVDVTDALLVLRYSMSIISSLPRLDMADVNGDSSVDLTDALLILRKAMGISNF